MKLVLLLACAAAAHTAVGCSRVHDGDIPSAEEQKAENPLAGLHTPGSQIGLTEERRMAIAAEMAAAGAGGLSDQDRDLAMDVANGGDRCVGIQGTPGTPGMLTISFTSATYGGKYAPENCGAVWIEDAAGKYVTSPLMWARIRTRPLFFWQSLRCQSDPPDAVTAATLKDHEAHEATWDGKDLNGVVVPDGMYVVNIEVTEDEIRTGRRGEFPFMKGPAAATLMPADTESVRGLKLVYTPTPTTPGSNMDTGN